MIQFAILLLACLPPILGQTHANRCPGFPSAFNVNVSGCIEMPCSVERGETAVTELYFFSLSPKLIRTLTPQVLITTPFGVVPYPIPEEYQNGCANLLFGSCPLHFLEVAVYRISVTVDPSLPPSSISAQISLLDQHNNTVVCNSADISVT